MPELVPVREDVKIAQDTEILGPVQYGEAVNQGETVYLNSDGKYYLAENVDATLADVVGVAITPNVADGWGVIVTGGSIDLGVALSGGQTYSQASTKGKLEPADEVATGENVTNVGIALDSSLLLVDIVATGAPHA